MRAVIVEDDYLQADWIKEVLITQLGLEEHEIELIATELEFREKMPSFQEAPPGLFIIDVMLRWTDPDPEQVPPPEAVEREGYFRAGIRCEQLLRASAEMKNIPVILYTVLEENELREDIASLGTRTSYLGKSTDDIMLVNRVKELTWTA